MFNLFKKKNKLCSEVNEKTRMFNLVNQYCNISLEDFLALSDEDRINLKFATLRSVWEHRIINERKKNEC